MNSNIDTPAHIVAGVVDAVGELAELHVELYKAELARDARALVRDAMPFVAGVPLIGVSYVFICVAIALGFSTAVGGWGGFLIVAVFNLLVGAVAVRIGVGRLGTRRGRAPTFGPELRTSARGLAEALSPFNDRDDRVVAH